MLMLSCVGFSLAARLAQAIVLAVGPLFIAAALFDMSIGLFVGWLRAMIALFIAQTGYVVSAALELSFLTGDLSRLQTGAVVPTLRAVSFPAQFLPCVASNLVVGLVPGDLWPIQYLLLPFGALSWGAQDAGHGYPFWEPTATWE